MRNRYREFPIAPAVITALLLPWMLSAQQVGSGSDARPPIVTSPEVQGDQVTFRIFAPRAQGVRLIGADMPGDGQGMTMNKDEGGVWQLTVGPLEPGSYRYTFNVDGVTVVDPRNPSTSESNASVSSLVHIPGSDFMDLKNVPHGAVAAVHYFSMSLKGFRRMHVYTPPGYEFSQSNYPVLYLLHGGADSDETWTSVGRVAFIMDNMIASGKAKPMIVVLPAGQTTRVSNATGRLEEFIGDFLNDLMPYVESHYRVTADAQHRAMAGLSMGGLQTLNVAIPHVEKFAYIGIFSSGLVSIVPGRSPEGGPGPVNAWEQEHKAQLETAGSRAKKDLKLLWFATGVDDNRVTPDSTRLTVEMLRKYGFDAKFKETPGAHTWTVWRKYLNEFAPLLFQ
jgi:enterochelin esterase-like enzyme